MKKLTVLGGGLVGGYIARTLHRAGGFEVFLADRDEAALNAAERAGVTAIKTDLTQKFNVISAVAGVDLVVGAVPGFMGYSVVEAVIRARKPVVDISFFPEDPLGLDELAREHNVPVVVDCGVMPGLGGMIAAHLGAKLDEPRSLAIYVGGLPVERDGLLDYKAPFSPSDVLEEYTRPARLRRGGVEVVLPALSEIELLDAPEVGQLEAFNTDGLRTLLGSFDWPEMKEKTLRWPGHADKIKLLDGLGFLATEDVGDSSSTALGLTEKLLRKAWAYKPGEREFTFMRVEAGGLRDGDETTLRCDLLDYTDADGNMSMARTTGLPAIAAAQLLAEDRLTMVPPGSHKVQPVECGVVCPEWLGTAPAFEFTRELLRTHGIELRFSETSA